MSKRFKRLAALAGLVPIKLHEARHSANSLMRDAGVANRRGGEGGGRRGGRERRGGRGRGGGGEGGRGGGGGGGGGGAGGEGGPSRAYAVTTGTPDDRKRAVTPGELAQGGTWVVLGEAQLRGGDADLRVVAVGLGEPVQELPGTLGLAEAHQGVHLLRACPGRRYCGEAIAGPAFERLEAASAAASRPRACSSSPRT